MQSAIVFAALAVLAVAQCAPQFIYSGIPAVASLTSSQYHAQDELGQYSYGYAGGPSAKSESKDAFGNVRGSYSYIDANGITQTTNYVADDNGFRVAATNLPVGPAGHAVVAAAPVAQVHQTYAAAPVAQVHQTYVAAPAIHHAGFVASPIHHAGVPLDTPEVQHAKIQHFAAHQEALARTG